MTGLLVGRVAGWLNGWAAGWLGGCTAGQLAGWEAGRLGSRGAGWLDGWTAGWLAGRAASDLLRMLCNKFLPAIEIVSPSLRNTSPGANKPCWTHIIHIEFKYNKVLLIPFEAGGASLVDPLCPR